VKVTAAELDVKIRAWLAAKHTGDIVLHVNEGRIESYDFKEHGRVIAGDTPHVYASAYVRK